MPRFFATDPVVKIDETADSIIFTVRPRPKAEDVKLVEGQKNIRSSVVIPEPIIVFTDPEKPRSPKEEIQRTKRLLAPPREKKKPLKIPDLFVIPKDERSLDELFCLPKDNRPLDQLFVGSQRVIRPPMTESQRLNEERIEEHNRAVDMRMRIENPSILEEERQAIMPETKAAIEEGEKKVQEIDDYQRFENLKAFLRSKGITI